MLIRHTAQYTIAALYWYTATAYCAIKCYCIPGTVLYTDIEYYMILHYIVILRYTSVYRSCIIHWCCTIGSTTFRCWILLLILHYSYCTTATELLTLLCYRHRPVDTALLILHCWHCIADTLNSDTALLLLHLRTLHYWCSAINMIPALHYCC